jgi:hypothetical protein
MSASERDGEAVLAEAVAVAGELLGDRLDAAFALGSLAHGGFAPLVSDVDLALVLSPAGTDAAETVGRVAGITRSRLHGPREELAGRLSVFWADWDGVRGSGPVGRLPEVDRLDLIDDGRLLAGTDRRAGAARPDHTALVGTAAEFVAERFDPHYLRRMTDPDALVRDGARTVTKAVLFPARFRYTLHTGEIGQNEHAARWYAAERLPGHELVSAAYRWRSEDLSPDAADLLRAHLVGLYRDLIDDYLARTAGPAMAARLAGRRAELDQVITESAGSDTTR